MVDYEVQGRVALITLNRPEARNAVNGDVATAMEAAIDAMEEDPEVWVGILRANTEGQERPVFCAERTSRPSTPARARRCPRNAAASAASPTGSGASR